MLQQSLYNSAILMQESGDPRDRSEALKRYGHIISIVCVRIKLLLSVVYCTLVSHELSVKINMKKCLDKMWGRHYKATMKKQQQLKDGESVSTGL